MSTLFGGGPKLENRATPNAPNASDPTIQAARDATAASAASVYGRAATNPTGGQGASAPAVTAKKTLLGGAGG